jgi:putative hydrolase of the HAD superfamily
MKYTAVFFDVGGTLMSMDRERVAREYVALAHARGVDINQVQARAMFAALDDEIPKRARQALPLSLNARAGERFWKTLFADGWSRLALPQDRAAVDHLYILFRRGDFNRLFEDTRPALDALKTRGLALGVLSNFTRNCKEVLQTLGIASYFSFFAVSSIVRKEKPDRAIFDYAVRAARRPAGEILHVGDSIHADVDGARAAGLNAILLDRDYWYPDYTTVPRIRRLTELLD